MKELTLIACVLAAFAVWGAAPISVTDSLGDGKFKKVITLPEGTDGQGKLDAFVDRGLLAGAVALIVSPDGVEKCWKAGKADIETGRPMTGDTMFWVASMTKYVTGIAVMIAQDDGKLNIADPVSKHIPEFAKMRVETPADTNGVSRLEPLTTPITIEQCLRHTAGFRYLTTAAESDHHGRLPLKDAVSLYTQIPLTYQPGTSTRYSNMGINAAARVVEIVTGKTFGDFVRERIFNPLGMKDSTFCLTKEQHARLARPYRFVKPHEFRFCPWHSLRNYYTWPIERYYAEAGGGLFSSPADIAKFARMIIAGGVFDGKRIVSEEGVELSARRGLGCNPQRNGDWRKDGAMMTEFYFSRANKRALVWMVQAFPHGDWHEHWNEYAKREMIKELAK